MDYEVDRLVFVVRSIADGIDKGFKAAEKAATDMATTYEKAERTEKQLEKALQSLKKELDQANKADSEHAAAIEQKIASLEEARTSLKSYVDSERKRTEAVQEAARAEAQSAQQRQESQAQMLAAVAVVGVLIRGYKGLSTALQESTSAYSGNRNAMVGLRSIAEGTGQDMGVINKAVQDLTADGLIPLEQASTAVKNLLSRGFEAQEAIDIILRLKDAAAFGRQASYSLADAVMTATEGLKNENSILVDNAGVTKNVAKMWQDYAKARGITTEAMTLAQKREAEYLGIMEETRHQVGDAAKLSAEFTGSQLALEASTRKLKVAIGEANVVGLSPMLSILNELVQGAANFATENQSLITFGLNFGKALAIGGAALILFRSNIKGMIAEMVAASPVLSKLTVQLGALKGAISGPWGWVTLGISAVVGVIAAIAGASAKAADELRELNEEAAELTRQALGADSLVNRYAELSDNAFRTKEETAEMHQISEKLVSSYGLRADGVSREGVLLVTNLEYMKEQLAVQKELARQKMEEAEAKNAEEIEKTINKLKEARATLKTIDAHIETARANYAAKQAELGDIGAGEAAGRAYAASIAQYTEALDALVTAKDNAMRTAAQSPTEIAEHVERSLVLAKAKIGEAASAIPMETQSAIAQAMTDMAYEGTMVDSDTAVSMFEQFFKLDKEAAVADGIAELTEVRARIIAGVSAVGTSDTDSLSVVNTVLRSLSSDATLSEAMNQAKILGQRIMDGVASASEKEDFDRITDGIRTSLADMQSNLVDGFKQAGLSSYVSAVEKAFAGLRNSASRTSAEIEGTTSAIRAQKTSVKEMIGAISGFSGSYESLKKEMQDLTDLQVAIDVLKEGNTASEDYGLALEYLADRYGVTAEQIAGNLDAYQQDADMKAIMIDLNYQLAIAEAEMAKATAQAMANAGTATQEQANKIIFALDGVLNKLRELDGASAGVNVDGDNQIVNVTRSYGRGGGGTPSWRKTPPRSRRGSGSRKASTREQSYKNEALERELELIERKRRLDQLTVDEEVAALLHVRAAYAKKAGERQEIDDKVYELRQQKRLSDLEHAKAMDRLSLAGEISAQRAIVKSFKAGTEARLEAERKLYELQKQQEQQLYDLAVYYDRLTTEEQIKETQRRMSQYKAGTEVRIELEKQLYDLQKKQRQQQYDMGVALDRLTLQDQITITAREIAQYKKGTDARMELEQRLHELKKQLAQSAFDRDVAMDRLTVAEQIKRLQQMANAYAQGTEARLALESQIYALEKQMKMSAYQDDVYYGRLTLELQAERIQEMIRQYKVGTDARIELEKQLYAVQQQIKERDQELERAKLEHAKAMNQLTLAEEITILEKKLSEHEAGTVEYMEVERQLYQARQEEVRRAYEIDVYYGRLTLEQQRERIRAMMDQYKEGTDARIELEKQLYAVQQQIKERDTQNLQKLADGVLAALRARYEAQRQAEEGHIRTSMDNWKEWSEAQREAIEEQIKALDELTKGEDRAEEERKRRRKIAALEQQLQYENDAYNRRKLSEQIKQEKDELAQWLKRNEREDAKEALRQQANEVDRRAQEEQKALEKQLEDLDKFYDERLKEYNLTAEAEQLIMSGNQKDIIKLIQSFAPAYDAVGKSLGERLYEGFASKAMDINVWFEAITRQIEGYRATMAEEASKVASNFLKRHGMPLPIVPPQDPGRPSKQLPTIVVNYYAEEETPAKMMRDLERMLDRLSRR